MATQLIPARHNNKWLAVLLMKWMGYSSFAAAIVSMLIYCYKKHTAITEDKKTLLKKKPLEISIRSTSSLANLHASRQLLTPPPSPQPTYSTAAVAANKSWSTRLIDGVISATRKRKRMTISLKNTVLWNPSSDVNTPNHAFHENTVPLLNRLAQIHDIYVIIHMNSDKERHQITQLLNNNPNLLLDSRKILHCSSEQGKLHLIRHLQPHIHVEGGTESDDGSFIINQLDNVEQKIWIKKNTPLMGNDQLQLADSILKTWIAL
ncbi:uncharacterized protein EV154DRAFT_533573 [Mucor mucedo]|uniref:uncharacterized protein n=1 Tax=Mucor mucedo TaxID=29922 RepID=UPI00222016EF|nr:uncharacterized protein EV154DRAFT_533573 [Mucor mucedo]KAI7865116.1 hypothetical protein EV154DRAFT_533573 [Mucor mucedo]